MKTPPPVKTIDRLVQILDSFCPDKPTWSLSELAAHLGWPKSTLHRFLISMESYGILRRDPADTRPGAQTTKGTRIPPSYKSRLPPRNGPLESKWSG